MKIKLLFCTFAVLLLCAAKAESASYANIDKRAVMAPIFMEERMSNLVEYLTRGTKTEKEKARAIAVWIASRVDYDDVKNRKIMQYVEKNKGKIPNTGDAFVTRKGVCLDFAVLFYRMAKEAGIKSVVVLGYAGTVSMKDKQKGTVAKHAWNAAKLDGKWYLLDVTWSSDNLQDKVFSETQYARDLAKRKKGSVSVFHESKRNSGRKTFKEQWFLTPPQEMIKTHFPDDDKWQLLNPKVTAKEFFK